MKTYNWHKFKFITGHILVNLDGKWKMVMENADLIEQHWRMRTHKWGHKKPKEGITYKMNIEGKFNEKECRDNDCEHTGCKHFTCFWANYIVDEKEYFEMKS